MSASHRGMPAMMPVMMPVLFGLLFSGCVRQRVNEPPARPAIFDFPRRVYSAGLYHGVQFFFEINPNRDLPQASEFIRREGHIPPLPRKRARGVARYEVGDVHQVEVSRGWQTERIQVGSSRYERQHGARLYVFKETPRDFEFRYRGVPVHVYAMQPWKPAVFVYSDRGRIGRRSGVRVVRRRPPEILQIGATTIRIDPTKRYWTVDTDHPRSRGRVRFDPRSGRTLEIRYRPSLPPPRAVRSATGAADLR